MKRLLPFLFAATVAAHATQTDNRGLHAVPAPGPVAIDGQLNDWDLSGAVWMCYDWETLRETYAARFAVMYDADHLYVALHWKDRTPMGNSHDPRYAASKAWAGDAVQLRLKTDRISHLTAWYYAPHDEPGLFIDYGQDLHTPFKGGSRQLFQTHGHSLEGGVEMAFRRDDDGQGYVQEIALPWNLVTLGKIPAPGEQFNMGVELLWGEADWPVHRYADNLADGATSREFFFTNVPAWGTVTLEPKGHLALPEPAYLHMGEEAVAGPVPIAYRIPAAGLVTLAIDDEAGHRVRNLIAAQPRLEGEQVEPWDGLNDRGEAVPPGSYRFKLLTHAGVHARYTMSFANPGHPTWQTPDGRGAFYGDHTAAHAVATAGDYVALACPIGEAGQPLIGLDLEGQRLWGQANRVFGGDGIASLASDGKTLWVASDGEKAIVYRVELATGKYAPWSRTGRDEQGHEYRLLELPVSDRAGGKGHLTEVAGRNLTALACRDGVLALCLQQENLLKLLDAETGAERRSIVLPEPRSVAIDRDGSLVVLAQGRLWRVPAGANPAPIGSETLAESYGVALDRAGQIYVSVRGADQDVRVFSPEGHSLRTIGLAGGRPADGPYLEGGMRNPAQIAIDRRDRLWVTEETTNPKRTSVWDTASGRLLRDLAGTTSYAGAGAINPDDPTMAFADDTIYRIDLATGAWKPVYSLARRDDPADLFPPRVQDITTRAYNHGGKTYAWSRPGTCVVFDGERWHSAARLGTVKREKNHEHPEFQSPLFEGHEGESFAWADANGDGLVQADELTFAALEVDGHPARLATAYWGTLPNSEGTLTYYVDGSPKLLQFPVSGYNAAGAPLYQIDRPRVIAVDPHQLKMVRDEGMTITGEENRVYLNQNPLTALDAQGGILGTYPSDVVSVHGSHRATPSRPGYLIGPSSFLGTAVVPDFGEIFYLNGNLGENYLFTSDALWIQALFKDTRGGFETPSRAERGESFDGTTAGGESFGGNFIRAHDGRYYLTLGGTDAHVLEITGLETLRRFAGRFDYTPEQYAAAQAQAEHHAAKINAPRAYAIAPAGAPIAIDGKAAEWPELLRESGPVLEIRDDERSRSARVEMRYDTDHLYLAYRVFSPHSQMKNGGQDERLLFKSGDAVDLMLNGRRILMTIQDHHPLAMLNQKSAPGAPAAERFAFSSPWRTISFDRVVPLPEVQLATGPIQNGYFVEAAIPWSVLGIEPKAGLSLRGDVGVLSSDAEGTQTVARHYWSNKATGLVNDVPGEADLTPSLWGTFTLK